MIVSSFITFLLLSIAIIINEFPSHYCKRVGFFYAIFSLKLFCAFLLEHSLTSQVNFSRLRSSFLSDLYCFDSELKPAANIKLVAVYQLEGLDSQVGIAFS